MSDEQRAMKAGVVGVFGRAAATYDSVGPRFFAHFGRRLVEIAELAPGARVLDAAAGRGAVLFPTAERTRSVLTLIPTVSRRSPTRSCSDRA